MKNGDFLCFVTRNVEKRGKRTIAPGAYTVILVAIPLFSLYKDNVMSLHLGDINGSNEMIIHNPPSEPGQVPGTFFQNQSFLFRFLLF